MKFGEIVAPTIKELFMQKIEGMILSGELKPGDSLPTERELSDEMKISKTVIHEGIRELSRLGFLDVVSRKGVTVADYAQNGNLDTLMAIMKYNSGRLDKKTMRSLLDIRIYLECPALEALGKNHTEEDLKVLEKLLEDAKTASKEDIHTLSHALFYFHRTLVFLSGNTLTPLIMNAFMPAGLTFWEEYIRRSGIDFCIKRLEFFLECIRNGDGKKAADVLKQGLIEFDCEGM
ncbi:MAG: FadR/GntR family transcriptional regulator [Lachnospiraceae bacterium]